MTRTPLYHHGHQTEQQVTAERRFRLVVEAAPNAMGMIDKAGHIVMANAAPCDRGSTLRFCLCRAIIESKDIVSAPQNGFAA